MISSVFINQGCCNAGKIIRNIIESESINPKDVTIRVGKEELKVFIKSEELVKAVCRLPLDFFSKWGDHIVNLIFMVATIRGSTVFQYVCTSSLFRDITII